MSVSTGKETTSKVGLNRVLYLERVNEFALSLIHQHTLDDIIWKFTESVISVLGFDDCVVYLLDDTSGVLLQKAALGPKNPVRRQIKDRIEIKIGKGIVGSVAQSGISEIIDDTSIDPRYIIDDDVRLSEITIPIKVNGRVIGIIDSEHAERGFYNEDHLKILTEVTTLLAEKIKFAKIQEELKTHKSQLERIVQERTRELNDAVEKLKQSNTDLVRFAYASSHDLREPIRMISTFLQLIKMKEQNLNSESVEYIDFIIGNAKRLQDMLDGLLSYSKLNVKDIAVAEIDFDEFIQDVLKNLKFQIQQSNAHITLPEDVPNIRGHRILLLQLFQNLISNSIKFRREDCYPEIVIHYSKEPKCHLFIVDDNGVGIDHNSHKEVFRLFNRLKSTEQINGSGIGLALCKNIVIKHNGSIQFVDKLGEGARIEVRIAV